MTKESKGEVGFPGFERPWEKNDNDIWLASTISLYRNIDKFHFPQKLSKEKRENISNLIVGVLKELDTLKNVQVFFGNSISPLERDFLMEHFLIFDTARDSQNGQAYVTEQTGRVLVQVNAHEHMQLHIVDPSGDLEGSLEQIFAVERGVEEKLPFAFSNTFGYLTSEASRCGTALLVQSFVHIPAIIQQGLYEEEIGKEEMEGVSFSGLRGDPHELIGDLLVVKNRWTVGLKEETILSSLRAAVMRVVDKERTAREKIAREKEEGLIDKMSRAIGTLQHARTIDTKETLQAMSLIKLAVELGWIEGMSSEKINELFFDCRRAHLAKRLDKDLYASPKIHKERADFLREVFAPVRLT